GREPVMNDPSGHPTNQPRHRNVGGTSGGLGDFLGGLLLLGIGGWLFLSRIYVASGFWSYFGPSSFGMTVLPIFAGVALLFFDGKSVLGWLLSVGGAAMILLGVISELHIYFRPTSLIEVLLMLGMIAAGIGMIGRAVRPH